MNRLAPLITRSVGPLAAMRVASAPSSPFEADLILAERAAPAPGRADDIRLFATAWLAGVIFFGTLLA